MKRTLRRISHVCRKYIEHKKCQRGKNKVTSFVHSKPACEIEGESTTEGKGTKKVEGKKKSPAKEPSKCRFMFTVMRATQPTNLLGDL